MEPLTPQQLEELRDAIVGAFDETALVQMLSFKLGKDLFRIVARGPFNTVAFNLLILAEQEGWTRALITAVALVRPGNTAVQRFCQSHAFWALTPADPQSMITPVTSGVAAISALAREMNDPKVREIVGAFRAEVGSGLREFDYLRRYKALHDRLHMLEVRFYRELASAVAPVSTGGPSAFRTDESRLLTLDSYCRQLRREVTSARDEASGLDVRTPEDDWIDEYDRAVQLLTASLDGADDTPARTAVGLIKGLLGETSRINNNMALCASRVPLNRLTRVMGALADHLGANAAPGAGAPRFRDRLKAAVESLHTLEPRLQGLIREHTEWQWLDKEFAAATDQPGVTLTDRFPRWPRVRERLLRLCDLAPAKEWATELRLTVERLEGTTEPVAFRRTFATFRQLARDRFFDVDKEMNDLSGRLIAVAHPLADLMEGLTDA